MDKTIYKWIDWFMEYPHWILWGFPSMGVPLVIIYFSNGIFPGKKKKHFGDSPFLLESHWIHSIHTDPIQSMAVLLAGAWPSKRVKTTQIDSWNVPTGFYGVSINGGSPKWMVYNGKIIRKYEYQWVCAGRPSGSGLSNVPGLNNRKGKIHVITI